MVVPWQEFLALIVPLAPVKATGRKPFPIEATLCTHFMQQWLGLSDVAMEEALYDVPLYRQLAKQVLNTILSSSPRFARRKGHPRHRTAGSSTWFAMPPTRSPSWTPANATRISPIAFA